MSKIPEKIIHWKVTSNTGDVAHFRAVSDIMRYIAEAHGHCLLTQSSFSTCSRGAPKGLLKRVLQLYGVESIVRIK